MFDFVVTELQAREHGHGDEQRIRAVRVALENQRDDLLAFAGVLDGELSAIAQVHDTPETIGSRCWVWARFSHFDPDSARGLLAVACA